MELFNKTDKILEIFNETKILNKISLEEISIKIRKDKSVTSRILNGKYNLDLETYINLCLILNLDPSTVLDKVINPNVRRIPITEASVKMIDELINTIKITKQNN